MPKKKSDLAPTQPSVPSPESTPLSFTIETFDDPETGRPTQYGRFSRNWQDEEALDVLIDKLEAGQLSHKQALMQARKLEATTPYNLEIQNFIANRLWALGLQDEAAEVYERAYKQALVHIPTYLRRGIAANPYMAEGLTGRTVLSEHLYWHASNVHGPEWAVDYLESAVCDWTPEEIDFVDWVFNASPVLKERAEMMALHEKSASYAQRSLDFMTRITDTLSKQMVRKVKNRWGDNIWAWTVNQAIASVR
jgi:hypothetical protein